MPSQATLSLGDRLAVYFVTDPKQTPGDLTDLVGRALSGGVTAVQLRAKRLNDRDAVRLARALGEQCAAHGALFLVNDRLDLALAAGADGIHLGVDDLPLEDATRLARRVRPDGRFIIGYSPEDDDQAATAAARGADYLGVGPVFGTASKPDAGPAIGLAILARRVAAAGIPVVGIGGITAANARSVVLAGTAGVAVVGAIAAAADPAAVAAGLAAEVRGARPTSAGRT